MLCQFPQKERFYRFTEKIGSLKLTFNYDNFNRESIRYIQRRFLDNKGYTWGFSGEQSVTSYNNYNNTTIRGPVSIKIEMLRFLRTYRSDDAEANYPLSIVQPEQNWRIFFKKEKASYLQAKTQLQALVLPKNTKNTRLVVESSEDLVNWKLDTPGPKTTTNRERFFRLRAVKE